MKGRRLSSRDQASRSNLVAISYKTGALAPPRVLVRTATESRRKSPVEMNVRGESRPPAAMSGDLLIRTAEIAADWLQSLDPRPPAPSATVAQQRPSRVGPPP